MHRQPEHKLVIHCDRPDVDQMSKQPSFQEFTAPLPS
jgi:hypothetical protein